MPKIFISYRRDDAQWPARSLNDALRPHVADPKADVFMDIDNIPLGVNFAQHIDGFVAQCDVMLALIGRNWLDARGPDGARRLDNLQDFVRIEIGLALRRGIPVVPVLLDGAPIPSAHDLPDDLKELSQRNGVEVRHATFQADVERLIQGLGLLRMAKPPRAAAARLSPKLHAKPSRGNSAFLIVGALALLVAVGVGGWGYMQGWFAPVSPASKQAGAAPAASLAGSLKADPAESAAWHMADSVRLGDAYKSYLESFPAGVHAGEAKAALARIADEADWTKAAGGVRAQINAYLAAHPGGAHTADANSAIARIDEAERLAAAAKSDAERREIERRAAEQRDQDRKAAERQADENAWKIAGSASSAAAYRAYAVQYPNGAHVTEARAAAAKLESSPVDKLSADLRRIDLQAPGIDLIAVWSSLRQTYSLETFQAAADMADAKAAAFLGRAFDVPLGVPQDYGKARSLYAKACDGGELLGCSSLGVLYQNGQGAAQDYGRARTFYEKACDGGHVSGCSSLGVLYQNGQGVAQDYGKARTFYEKACNGGYAAGCSSLGVLYQNGLGVSRDYSKTRTLFEKACSGGQMPGCSSLGVLYENGQGVARDYSEARALYERACDGGHMPGCSSLGVLYQNSLGAAQDYSKARTLYEKACEGGHMPGCSSLGVLYQNGQGVPRDFGEARRLYEKACDGGNMPGCSSLGVFYQNGQGVSRDYNEARRLYEKACDGGHMPGCGSLAVLYINGQGVSRDYVKARALYRKACDAGEKAACDNLVKLPSN